MEFTQKYFTYEDGRRFNGVHTVKAVFTKEELLEKFKEFSKTATASKYDSVESQFASLITRQLSEESGLPLGDDVHVAVLEIIKNKSN